MTKFFRVNLLMVTTVDVCLMRDGIDICSLNWKFTRSKRRRKTGIKCLYLITKMAFMAESLSNLLMKAAHLKRLKMAFEISLIC